MREKTDHYSPALIHAGLHYFTSDDAFMGEIVDVVSKLPHDVIDFVLEECAFFSCGRAIHGTVITVDTIRDFKWIIVLYEGSEAKDRAGIIAHEIAHAWKGHDRFDTDADSERCRQFEVEAVEQTILWGFTGLGANIDHCAGVLG